MSTTETETLANDAATPPRSQPEIPAQRYIVVEGPIGVGKTSLARRLASTLEAELVLEQDAQNPFLERFYKNPKAGALPAQLFFLFQRAQQLGSLKQQDLFAPRRVADYLFENWKRFLAFGRPYFFRSTIRGSRVSRPSALSAARNASSASTSARATPSWIAPA